MADPAVVKEIQERVLARDGSSVPPGVIATLVDVYEKCGAVPSIAVIVGQRKGSPPHRPVEVQDVYRAPVEFKRDGPSDA